MKKLLALIALGAATTMQAHYHYDYQYYGRPQFSSLDLRGLSTLPEQKFEQVDTMYAQSDIFTVHPELKTAHLEQLQFERKIQTGVMIGLAAAVTTFGFCAFMEWLQEFKLRKAEKAKLIAALQLETLRNKKQFRNEAKTSKVIYLS